MRPGRPVAGVGGGDSISDWFKELPLVTKLLTTGTVLTGALTTFNMISAVQLMFLWELIAYKFHFWRLFTSFIFAGPFSFQFVMHAFVLYENCRRYEQNPFNTGGGGNSADFLFMILFAMGVLCCASMVFELPIMSECLLYTIMYVWSRREPDTLLNMWGFKFKGLYCPWVYIAIRVLMGGSPTQPVIGVAVGHLFYFLIEVLPLSHGYDLLRTPTFCVDIVRWYTGMTGGGSGGGTGFVMEPPPQRGGAGGGGGQGRAGAPAAAGQPGPGTRPFPAMGAGHQWGQGRTLGTQ